MLENPSFRGERVSRVKGDICVKREFFGANIIASDKRQVGKKDSG